MIFRKENQQQLTCARWFLLWDYTWSDQTPQTTAQVDDPTQCHLEYHRHLQDRMVYLADCNICNPFDKVSISLVSSQVVLRKPSLDSWSTRPTGCVHLAYNINGPLILKIDNTSSPPRWMKLSLNTPGDGFPGLLATPKHTFSNTFIYALRTMLPPVHSFKTFVITSKVWLFATLSGWLQETLGQISGYLQQTK